MQVSDHEAPENAFVYMRLSIRPNTKTFFPAHDDCCLPHQCYSAVPLPFMGPKLSLLSLKVTCQGHQITCHVCMCGITIRSTPSVTLSSKNCDSREMVSCVQGSSFRVTAEANRDHNDLSGDTATQSDESMPLWMENRRRCPVRQLPVLLGPQPLSIFVCVGRMHVFV